MNFKVSLKGMDKVEDLIARADVVAQEFQHVISELRVELLNMGIEINQPSADTNG